MSLLPLEPLQKLIDIGMVLGNYGVEAKMNTKDQFIFLLLLLNNFTMVKTTHLILLNIFATEPV